MRQNFWLPFPPTSNTMFGLKGHHRFVSETYAKWKHLAGDHLLLQKTMRMDGCVSITIALRAPTKRKWDLDNRVKPILDLLVAHCIIEDDHSDIVREVIVNVGQVVGAEVTVEAIA